MKKIILIVLLSGCLAHTALAKTLRFGTSATYPPYEFIDENNQLAGFDIDLANALCKELQAECTFTNQSFDSLIPALRFRRFDIIAAGMDITPARQQQLLFSQPYNQYYAQFIVRKGDVSSVEQLKAPDKRIGVENGTTHQRYLNAKMVPATIVPYDSYQNAVLDLKNGRINAILGENTVMKYWAHNDKDLTVVDQEITDEAFYGTGAGFAFRKDNLQLKQQVDAALDKLKAEGTYQRIFDKWFK